MTRQHFLNLHVLFLVSQLFIPRFFFLVGFWLQCYHFQSHFLCFHAYFLSCSLLLSIHAITLFYLHFSTLCLSFPIGSGSFLFNRAPVAEETNLKSYLPRFSIQPLLLCFIIAYILNSFSHFHRFPSFLNKETSQLEFCASRRLPLSPLSTLQVSFLFSGQSSQTFQHEVNFTGTCAFHVSEATDKFEN